MDNNITHIITNNKQLIDDALLLKYSEGKATPEEQYLVEQFLNDDAFENDALEGINLINNTQETSAITNQLRASLKILTNKKNERKQKRKFKDSGLIYAIVVMVLLLAFAAYYIIKLKLK